MASSPASAPVFAPAGCRRGAVRLRRLQPGGATTLVAWLAGMAVGRAAVPAGEAGSSVEIAIDTLPFVPLPQELRFTQGEDAADAALPFPLPDRAAALALAGPGTVAVEGLRLHQGVLRGTAVTSGNALCPPALSLHVNGGPPRPVQEDAPRALPDGRCATDFSLPLLPGDLGDAGLLLAVQAEGIAAPLAQLAFAPVDPAAPLAQLASLEARLQRQEQGLQAGLARLDAALRARLLQQEQRIEAVIAQAAALLLDQAARQHAADALADSPDLAALRALVDSAAASGAERPLSLPPPAPVQEIGPASPHFLGGWHALEQEQGAGFRWMGAEASIACPDPDRPLLGVTLALRHVYGTEAPLLRAWLDGLEAVVTVAPGEVVVTPRGAPAACRLLQLESLAGDSPAARGDSVDTRYLSLAIGGARFRYG